MPKNNKPEDGIIIPIKYDYENAGVKECIKDINKLTTESGSGITKYRKMAKEIKPIYKKLLKSLDLSDEKVHSAMRNAEKKISNVDITKRNYDDSVSRYNKTKKAGKTEQLPFKENAKKNAYTKWKNSVIDAVDSVNKLANSQAKLEDSIKKSNAKIEEQNRKLKVAEAKKQAVELEKAEKIGQKLTKEKEKQIAEQRKAELAESKRMENDAKKSIAENERIEKANQKRIKEEERLIANQEKLKKQQKEAKLDFLEKKLNKISNRIKSINLGRLVAQIYMLNRAWKMLISFTDEASSWVENLNLLEVVFGDLNKQAKEFVKNASNNFGLDANALAQYVSTFKQMANAIGQTSQTGTRMAEALTFLALDISSLRNVDLKTAASDLASGIAGQVKPVRKYGFDITQTSIEEYLKQIGQNYSASTISQANKQLARTILLIKQSKDAWGDMAKTINTFANQQRVLNDQFATFKRLLGTVLIGTFQLGDDFETASKTAGIMTRALWMINGALLAINQILNAVVPQAENVNGAIATGADDAIDSYEELDEAINGSLANFDKFNTLSNANGQNDITSILEQAFNKEYAEYMDKFQNAMKNINMYSKEIANNILSFLFPNFKSWLTDNPQGTFEEWSKSTDELKGRIDVIKSSMFGWLQTVIAIKSPLTAILFSVGKSAINDTSTLETIVNLGKSLSDMFTRLFPLVNKIFDLLAPILVKLLEIIDAIVAFIDKNNLIIPVLGSVVTAILAVKALKFAFEIRKWLEVFPEAQVAITKLATALKTKLVGGIKTANANIQALQKSINGTTLAWSAFALVASFAITDSMLSNLSESEKKTASWAAAIVGSLVAVIAAVVALKGVASAGVAIPIALAGIGMAIAGVKGIFSSNKYAEGGFQSGGLFYAGEKGPEWLGRQGNTATIVNDTQMSDIMEESVARGVMRGNIAMRGNSQKQRPIVLNVNGKKFLEIIEEEAGKNGKQLARVK